MKSRDMALNRTHCRRRQCLDYAGTLHTRTLAKSASELGPLSLERTQIVTGNKTRNIPEIQSPEEFFQRSGLRTDPGKEGLPYSASGSITFLPDGSIVYIPP
jgi:hypothetical protein